MQGNTKQYQLAFEEKLALFLIFFCVALLGVFLMADIYWGLQ